jgi:ADP-heptose:LPS heptosyltransferase
LQFASHGLQTGYSDRLLADPTGIVPLGVPGPVELEEPDPMVALGHAEALLSEPGVALPLRVRALDALLLGFVQGSARPSTISAVTPLLETPGLAPRLYDGCLHVLAAAFWREPALLDDAVLRALRALLAIPGLPRTTSKLALEVLALVAITGSARALVSTIRGLLFDSRPSGVTHGHLIRLVGDGSRWRPDLVTLEDVLEILAEKHLAPHREFLLANVVERLAFSAAESFTPERFRRLRAAYRGHASFRYLAYWLAGRSTTPPETAHLAARLARARFPLHASLRAGLGFRHRRALVVHNIADGQGDEMVRVGPLVQALLDFNPELCVTIIARRTYLYEHPRVTPVAIDDAAATDAVLREPCDVVVHLFEPTPDIACRPELDPRVEEYVRSRGPFLHLAGRKALNHFVFDAVTVDGTQWAQRLRLDRRRVPGVYEATCRLAAELGLPLRAGEEPPRAGFLYAGTPSLDAEKEWARLVGRSERARESSGSGRPIVLVNPFGGQESLKGYTVGQFDVLAHELTGLVAEHRFVVLAPNGTPWGSAALAADVVSRLPAKVRAHVAVAPDPGPAAGPGTSRAPDARADQGMRLLKRFAAYADLVVTVEGWMMHLAYQLGRPYRVLLMPSSHVGGWYPHGANRNQVVAMGMAATPPARTAELRSGMGDPPTPSYPRKEALQIVLQALGEMRDPAARAFLLWVHGSPDRALRAAAAGGLARHGGTEVAQPVRAALRDSSAIVRAAAARGLLVAARPRDESLGVDDTTLRCHVLVLARDWQAVRRLGKAALPALSLAVEDADPVIRRDARWVFWQIVGGVPAGLRSAPEG